MKAFIYNRTTLILIVLLIVNVFKLQGQENCLNPVSLKGLDATWEKAQLELDYDFIEALLAEDFIWVHNHANTIDDKTAVLERVRRYLSSNNRSTKSRISKNVDTIIYGTTGVVTGITIVDRGPEPVTYNFMRTYFKKDGKCYLMANHTMAIPE